MGRGESWMWPGRPAFRHERCDCPVRRHDAETGRWAGRRAVPGDLGHPIRHATEAGILVLTANVTSWVRQPQPGSVRTNTPAGSSSPRSCGSISPPKTNRTVDYGGHVRSRCRVLVERYEGFQQGIADTKYQISARSM
jgi:hypothetical protein